MFRQSVSFDSHLISQLEFCPPLDVPLVRAIISDFDLGQHDQLAAVRNALKELKETAVLEEATGFDPSGSGGYPDANNGHIIEGGVSLTDTTDPTSISNDLSSPSSKGEINSDEVGGLIEGMESLTLNQKEALLREMFPSEEAGKISFLLRKNDGSVARAMDELLNHVFFREDGDEQSKVSSKGVDAFFEDQHIPQKRKKGKNRKERPSRDLSEASLEQSLVTSEHTSSNKWRNVTKDIDFIVSRTQVPHSTVSSLYHESGASLSGTIVALLKRQPTLSQDTASPEDLTNAIDLQEDFKALTTTESLALISLTRPSTANAHQLAQALFTKPDATSPLSRTGIDIVARYEPIAASDVEEHTSVELTHQSAPSVSPAHLAAARDHAWSRASASYRQGKSNRLFGGAAAYYAENGRIYNKRIQEQTALEAEDFVNKQSGSNYCDLHGVGVKDGVRIASQRVAAWWDGLGEGNIQGSRWNVGNGYRIVVGVGRHSKDGRPKLGPAVAKRLMNEGWRVEMIGGEIFVKGVMKKP